MARTHLCHVDEIEEGSSKGFALERPGRHGMFLVKHQGRLLAYLNDCPHWPGSPMAWRRDAYLNRDATRIVCSGHGAEFDIETGLCTHGPCVGDSLTPVILDIDVQGRIHAVIHVAEVIQKEKG